MDIEELQRNDCSTFADGYLADIYGYRGVT